MATIADAARNAKGRGADLLVTPEMFVSGYDNGPRVTELAAAPLAEQIA